MKPAGEDGSDAGEPRTRAAEKRLRLPSVRRMAAAGAAAVRRFPEVAVCAAVSALSAIVLLEASPPEFWLQLFQAASLGIPLFIAVTLYGERRVRPSAIPWMLRLLAAAVLVLLHFRFEQWGYLSVPQRYAHLSIAFHLLAAVAPYVGANEPRGFWQYNRELLFRFLLATLYAAAISAGLLLALAALDNLFGVDVPDLHYPRLICLVFLLFHPLFFLAGVPGDFAALDGDRRYPGGLRVFSQYVMLPIVALYVTILTAYLGKVLVTGTWPSGWISYLVSGLAVAGIFSLLLVHPDRMAESRNWIDRYALGFWIAILPSAAMVLLALWQRIDQYGITERRYLLGALAIWLTGTALHAAITRTREIRGIPLTLAILGVVTFTGPWSAYAVAERSQTRRLEEILTANGALRDGRVSPDTVEIPFDDYDQAEAVVTYLVQHHDTRSIDRWYGDAVSPRAPSAADGGAGADDVATADTLSLPAGLSRRVAGVMGHLRIRSGPSDHPLQLWASEPRVPVSAAGFDLLVVVGGDRRGIVAGDTLRFDLSADSLEVVMWFAGREEARAPLAPVIARAEALRRSALRDPRFGLGAFAVERRDVPATDLVLELAGDRWSARLALNTLTLHPRDGGLVAGSFQVDAALLRAAEPPL